MASAPRCRMSVASFVEAAMVIESKDGPIRGESLDLLIDEAAIELVPVTAEHAYAARQAWRRFGKGNHPAGLNFGRLLRLCTGGDQRRTAAGSRAATSPARTSRTRSGAELPRNFRCRAGFASLTRRRTPAHTEERMATTAGIVPEELAQLTPDELYALYMEKQVNFGRAALALDKRRQAGPRPRSRRGGRRAKRRTEPAHDRGAGARLQRPQPARLHVGARGRLGALPHPRATRSSSTSRAADRS